MSTLKTTQIAHPSSASNNIVLDSSGGVTLSNNLTVDTSTLFVDATNNRVGIGTTAPGAPLSVLATSSTYQGMELITPASDGSGEFIFGVHQSGSTSGRSIVFKRGGSDGTATESCRIDDSGRLLVGTASSLQSDSLIQAYKSSGEVRILVDSNSLSNGESALLRAEGGSRAASLGVYKHAGITNPCAYLTLVCEDIATNFLWVDNSDVFRISTNASHVGTTSGTVVGAQTSDERLKNILGPVEYGLDSLKQLEPVRYSLKSEPDTEKLGFIAQQVQPIIPQSVFDTGEHIEGEPEEAPTKLGMEYVALIPVLVNAIKELSAENESLKARLDAAGI